MPDDLPILAARLRAMQRELDRRHREAQALHAEHERIEREHERIERAPGPWDEDLRPPEPDARQ